MVYSTTVAKFNNIEYKLLYPFVLLLLFEYLPTKMSVNVIKCPFKGMQNVFIKHFINDCFQSINLLSRYANSKATMSFALRFSQNTASRIGRDKQHFNRDMSLYYTSSHSQGGTVLVVARGGLYRILTTMTNGTLVKQ